MKKILIIHTAFIGDIILATPMLSAIKNTYPDCLIDFITIPASANLLEKDPNLNNLIIFDKRGDHKGIKGLNKIAKSLDKNYDACICPHRSFRSAIIAKQSKARIRVGFTNSSWKGAFTHLINYQHNLHETQRNLSLLNVIGIYSKNTRPRIYEDEQDRKAVDLWLNDNNLNNIDLISVAPGSAWPTKKWPLKNYIEVIDKIKNNNIKIVLIGGAKDKLLCEEIATHFPKVLSLAGELTLRQTKYFLTKCKAVLSNDSAPLHLGLAANILVFSIFGPTIEEFGFAPKEDNSYIIDNKSINCRPCGIHGSYKCPTKTFDCMEEISTEFVVEKILDKIA